MKHLLVVLCLLSTPVLADFELNVGDPKELEKKTYWQQDIMELQLVEALINVIRKQRPIETTRENGTTRSDSSHMILVGPYYKIVSVLYFQRDLGISH
jgi:hypothetical protein